MFMFLPWTFRPLPYPTQRISLLSSCSPPQSVAGRCFHSHPFRAGHLITEIEKGLLHRAFSVFLFNSENKLLLQQRADEKITFPEVWTNTCCSHPLYRDDETNGVEGAKNAAVRKLDHELGITDVKTEDLQFLTRMHYKALQGDGVWGEHEIDYIFFAKKDVKHEINPNEIKAVRYVSKDELEAMLNDKALKFSPWFNLIKHEFLYKWWDSLIAGDLEKHVDTETVHKL
uniref:isopentenyl-diphosphate Delta-isomerase n=1 Tax=Palpitomonas bilix TaxID=652834 RepID=A0A7S3DAD1_9EUKA|mmetsp:Transcript_29203/g.75179  ORF Transcript_29203/g.75179 Transcript_29203/m.75179 type:complete len:229 (+) Transcript_29203:244-930(+)